MSGAGGVSLVSRLHSPHADDSPLSTNHSIVKAFAATTVFDHVFRDRCSACNHCLDPGVVLVV